MNNELPKIECIETLAYNVKYTASDVVCHEMLCDAVMRRIVPSEIALDIAEQYAVRSFTEQTASDLQEELDRLDAIERDTEGELNLPQETPEETKILDAAEAYHLRRGQALYWDGSDLTTRPRHWSTVELVYHGDHGVGETVVMGLSEWSRPAALELLRSHSLPGSDLSQETSEQRIERYREQLNQPCDETPEEKELLDIVERLILSPGGCVYYNGDSVSFQKRSWQDICLVAHYDDDMPCRVVDLGQWVRHDALAAIRSLNERLQSV